MKRNKKYVFLTAEELAHKLTFGKKKHIVKGFLV